MNEDKFDVIIVGAGVAGCVAGYLLAKQGLSVLIIERGDFGGAKNTSGGRIYAHTIEQVFPDFAATAPIQRVITHERLSFMSGDSCTSIEYSFTPSDDPKDRSYSVLRAKFDEWLLDQASSAGAEIITGIRVDDLLKKDGKVCGVISGDEQIEASVVLLADGANSTICAKNGLGFKIDNTNCAVGVKEVLELSEQTINERFACKSGEGVAWLMLSDATQGHMGGGFVYTNKDSISLGVVLGLDSVSRCQSTLPAMLDDLKSHPAIAPIIKDAKLAEYSAHVIPEGGFNALGRLSDDGVLVLGDAAGLCINIGYCVRGMDMAVESAMVAASTVIGAKDRGDFSKSSLSEYDKELAKSASLSDMRLYKNAPQMLLNGRIFKEYPKMINSIMADIFTINGKSDPLLKKLVRQLKKVGFLNLIKDLYRGIKSL